MKIVMLYVGIDDGIHVTSPIDQPADFILGTAST